MGGLKRFATSLKPERRLFEKSKYDFSEKTAFLFLCSLLFIFIYFI